MHPAHWHLDCWSLVAAVHVYCLLNILQLWRKFNKLFSWSVFSCFTEKMYDGSCHLCLWTHCYREICCHQFHSQNLQGLFTECKKWNIFSLSVFTSDKLMYIMMYNLHVAPWGPLNKQIEKLNWNCKIYLWWVL